MARSKRLKAIRRWCSVHLIKGVIGVFRLLPRRVGLALGGAFGTLLPLLAPGLMRKAVANLTIAFGDTHTPDDIRQIARRSFRMLAWNFVDTARLVTMSADDLNAICVPHEFDRLTRAIDGGRGVVGLTSHAGCWELLGVYVARAGVPTSVVARRLYDPRLDEILVETRASGGEVTLSRGRDTRDVIRTLSAGRLLGVLIDQDIPKIRGDFVPFFGHMAYTPTAPAQLALRYNAPMIAVLTYRDSDHRHHIWVSEEIAIEPTGDMDADVLALTAAGSLVIERFIAEHPDQWVWIHDRWKTTPEHLAGKKP